MLVALYYTLNWLFRFEFNVLYDKLVITTIFKVKDRSLINSPLMQHLSMHSKIAWIKKMGLKSSLQAQNNANQCMKRLGLVGWLKILIVSDSYFDITNMLVQYITPAHLFFVFLVVFLLLHVFFLIPLDPLIYFCNSASSLWMPFLKLFKYQSQTDHKYK